MEAILPENLSLVARVLLHPAPLRIGIEARACSSVRLLRGGYSALGVLIWATALFPLITGPVQPALYNALQLVLNSRRLIDRVHILQRKHDHANKDILGWSDGLPSFVCRTLAIAFAPLPARKLEPRLSADDWDTYGTLPARRALVPTKR